jgi:hypothetical protein
MSDDDVVKFHLQVEKEMRERRLVMVGQGDIAEHRIDKLLIVDYDSETIIADSGSVKIPSDQISRRF